jgi:hypothetical protein
MVLEKGFAWNGKSYASLSQVAKAITGTSWNGHRFFGLRPAHTGVGSGSVAANTARRSGADTRGEATIAASAATFAPAALPTVGLGGEVRSAPRRIVEKAPRDDRFVEIATLAREPFHDHASHAPRLERGRRSFRSCRVARVGLARAIQESN